VKRLLVFGLIVLTAVIIQSSVLSRITLFGVAADLILVVVVSIGLAEGSMAGAGAGFAGGLLRDSLLEGPTGITALSYLTVGYLVGKIRPYIPEAAIAPPVAAVALGSLLGGTLHLFFSFLLGGVADPISRVAKVILLTSVYNTLLTPLVYPLVSRIVAIYPRERVYRW
jgi:rod shape-determining protein MreD